MNKDDKSEKIQNRESWLKIIIISLFSLLIAWKIFTSSITLNFDSLSITDIISLVLALFAIALSIAFYFKASDNSNLFYDNTYKFTKDVSEILGRIEAGFGERLRHIDEGYNVIRDRFDKIPVDASKVEKQVKHEEEEIRKKENERNQLIESLAQKAKLEENEKHELFTKLKEKDDELHNAKRELLFLQRRLNRAEISKDRNQSSLFNVEPDALQYIRNRLLPELGLENLSAVPFNVIRKRFENIKNDLPVGFLNDLKKIGFLDSKNNLTPRGLNSLVEMSYLF